jgi:hypothetical protein
MKRKYFLALFMARQRTFMALLHYFMMREREEREEREEYIDMIHESEDNLSLPVQQEKDFIGM